MRLLRWFTLVNGCISLWWFVSERPLEQKLIALAVLAVGLYTIWIVDFVAERERKRYERQIRELQRELLQATRGERPAVRRAA